MTTRRPRIAFLSLTAIVSLAFAMVAGSAQAHGSYWHHCRTPRALPIGSLRAHDLGCPKARRVLVGFYRKAQSEGPDVYVENFHCLAVKGGVVCRRGAQKLRVDGSPERLLDEPMTRLHPPQRRAAEGVACAGFRFTARLNHRGWRFIVSGIRVLAEGVTCATAKKTIKQLIRTHSVPGLRCEAGRPAWGAENHAYWSGYCPYPDGRKTTWRVEEYQLA